MAKRKIIWSNTAMKKLYAIFESDIRKGNGKSFSNELFKTITKQVRLLQKHPESGMKTSDESIFGLKIETFLIYFELKADMICIHFVSDNGQDKKFF